MDGATGSAAPGDDGQRLLCSGGEPGKSGDQCKDNQTTGHGADCIGLGGLLTGSGDPVGMSDPG